MNGSELLPAARTILLLVMLTLTGAILLAFFRLVRGPSLPDRVIALDLISILAVGIIAAYTLIAGQPVLLDVGLVLALIAFLGTVAFARYLEKRASRE